MYVFSESRGIILKKNIKNIKNNIKTFYGKYYVLKKSDSL